MAVHKTYMDKMAIITEKSTAHTQRNSLSWYVDVLHTEIVVTKQNRLKITYQNKKLKDLTASDRNNSEIRAMWSALATSPEETAGELAYGAR